MDGTSPVGRRRAIRYDDSRSCMPLLNLLTMAALIIGVFNPEARDTSIGSRRSTRRVTVRGRECRHACRRWSLRRDRNGGTLAAILRG
jgi:hypothetical protein